MLCYKRIIYIFILFYLFKLTSKYINWGKRKRKVLLKIVGGEHQRRLLKYLLDENNHNPLERPVYNDTHSLTVTMNLALQQIIDFVSV